MFADPGFVKAELVEMLDQLHIPLERQRGILPDRMERGQEDPEFQVFSGIQSGHGSCVPL
jgi:hypothetical protein